MRGSRGAVVTPNVSGDRWGITCAWRICMRKPPSSERRTASRDDGLWTPLELSEFYADVAVDLWTMETVLAGLVNVACERAGGETHVEACAWQRVARAIREARDVARLNAV